MSRLHLCLLLLGALFALAPGLAQRKIHPAHPCSS